MKPSSGSIFAILEPTPFERMQVTSFCSTQLDPRGRHVRHLHTTDCPHGISLAVKLASLQYCCQICDSVDDLRNISHNY